MLETKLEISQQLKLTPKLMQSLNILTLNRMELVQFIETLYTENPCVEIAYETPFQSYSKIHTLSHNIQDDDDSDPINSVEDHSLEDSLPDYLMAQINLNKQSQNLESILRFIVNNLDANGFYPLSSEETLKFMKWATIEDIDKSLSILCALDPSGVCCRDLKDSLCCQAARLGKLTPATELIIKDGLELYAQGKLHSLKNQFGIRQDDIDEFRKLVPLLNPKPGASFGRRSNSYIIPDIFIHEKNGEISSSLNDKYIPKVYVSNYYKNLNNTDSKTQKYIEHKISSAQWAIECLERRNKTILLLAQEITQSNKSFFLTGKGSFAAMTMQDVADKVGVHVSTISRGVKGKYLQCVFGTYPLKAFFNRGERQPQLQVSEELAKSDINSAAPDYIMIRLQHIIENEDKKKPYSDEKIAKMLNEQGYSVARRTVVKYREKCNIPSSVERKERY